MYQVIGGDGLQRYHLKSVIMGDQLGGVTALDGLSVDIFRGVSNPDLHRAVVERAMKKIKAAGQVGEELVRYAQATDLDILCWPGLPGEMLCPAEVATLGTLPGWDDLGVCSRATIMWDPYKSFTYFTRHNANGVYLMPRKPERWAAAAVAAHERSIKDLAKFELNQAVMPSWIVLAHELGHYYHWGTCKGWFEACLRNNQINVIEARNLEDHEMPILDHAGLPFRYLYQDFKGGSNDLGTAGHGMKDKVHDGPGTDSFALPGGIDQIIKDMETRLKALRTAKEHRQAQIPTQSVRNAGQKLAKVRCPRCNKMVNEKGLNQPCNSMLHA